MTCSHVPVIEPTPADQSARPDLRRPKRAATGHASDLTATGIRATRLRPSRKAAAASVSLSSGLAVRPGPAVVTNVGHAGTGLRPCDQELSEDGQEESVLRVLDVSAASPSARRGVRTAFRPSAANVQYGHEQARSFASRWRARVCGNRNREGDGEGSQDYGPPGRAQSRDGSTCDRRAQQAP
jgi:hypothetical protein